MRLISLENWLNIPLLSRGGLYHVNHGCLIRQHILSDNRKTLDFMLYHLFCCVANHKLYRNVFLHLGGALQASAQHRFRQEIAPVEQKNLEESEFTHEFRKKAPYHGTYCYLDMKCPTLNY